jgi:hypothetical protein
VSNEQVTVLTCVGSRALLPCRPDYLGVGDPAGRAVFVSVAFPFCGVRTGGPPGRDFRTALPSTTERAGTSYLACPVAKDSSVWFSM